MALDFWDLYVLENGDSLAVLGFRLELSLHFASIELYAGAFCSLESELPNTLTLKFGSASDLKHPWLLKAVTEGQNAGRSRVFFDRFSFPKVSRMTDGLLSLGSK